MSHDSVFPYFFFNLFIIRSFDSFQAQGMQFDLQKIIPEIIERYLNDYSNQMIPRSIACTHSGFISWPRGHLKFLPRSLPETTTSTLGKSTSHFLQLMSCKTSMTLCFLSYFIPKCIEFLWILVKISTSHPCSWDKMRQTARLSMSWVAAGLIKEVSIVVGQCNTWWAVTLNMSVS